MRRPHSVTAGRKPLETVIVIGGSQIALMAAIAVKRASPRTHVGIAPAPVAQHALADRAHTTLPSLARLHDSIGMDEAGMIARAAATHRLATLYREWAAGPQDWLLAYGSAPVDAVAGFAARWASADAVAAGDAARRQDGGVTAALARSGCFARPSDVPGEALSELDYALRFDPMLYAERLRSLARHLGISGAAMAEAGDADLVIDTRAAEVKDTWIDWSKHLPARSISISAHPPALDMVDQVQGRADGYLMVSPGRDATRHVAVHFDAPPGAIAISAGRRLDAWTGRTVALGDAAAIFEPLGWCNLHLALCQIELLIELLPGRDIVPLEQEEYNRRAGLLADNVRDFVAAHHMAREDQIRSPALTHRIREFSRRGRIPFYEEDSVPRDLWLQLLGAMCPTQAAPPQQLALSQAEHRVRRAAFDAQIDEALAVAEPYPQWLAREIGAPR